MKYLLIICFIPILAFTQDKVMRVYKNDADSLILVKYPQSKTIKASDGMVYRWKVPEPDTARFFESATGEVLEATTTFRKVGTQTVKVDSEQGFRYSSTWQFHGPTATAGWHNATMAFSPVQNSSATYSFVGTKIELWAEKKPTHGVGTIWISPAAGGTPIHTKEVSFSGANELPALIYESPFLVSGSYTISLICKSGYVLLDYVIITK